MDAEFKKEFEDLAVVINAGFEGMEKRMDEKFAEIRGEMATKEDLKRFATKEDLAQVESRLDAKIDIVKDTVDDIKVTVEKLDARDKADTDAMVHEIASVKQRLNVLEHTR